MEQEQEQHNSYGKGSDLPLTKQKVSQNASEIDDLKSRVDRHERELSELKSSHQVTQQNINHIMENMDEVKKDIRGMSQEMRQTQIDNLKEYKSAVWKIGALIVASVAGGFLMMAFGIN